MNKLREYEQILSPAWKTMAIDHLIDAVIADEAMKVWKALLAGDDMEAGRILREALETVLSNEADAFIDDEIDRFRHRRYDDLRDDTRDRVADMRQEASRYV